MLITVEGGEGSGKGTLVNNLASYFEHQGEDVVTAREPGSVAIAEEIRDVIQRPRADELNVKSELFLFEAARAAFIDNYLKQALEEHDVVILDRYYDSTTAYQGYGRELDIDLVAQMNHFAADGVIPDITFYLDVAPETGLRRCERDEFGDDGDRIEQASVAFHRRVREGYQELAEKHDRIHVIDAETNGAQAVFEEAKRLLE